MRSRLPTRAANDLPNIPDWDENQRLQSEKEVLGYFVSGHPLDKYAEKLRNLPGVVDTATALEMKPAPATFRRGQPSTENEIAIAGVIVGLKVAKSKRSGELYAQASLEDTVGKIDLICFPKDYEKLAANLKIEVPVLVRGQLRAEEDAAPKVSVSFDSGAGGCEGEAAAECEDSRGAGSGERGDAGGAEDDDRRIAGAGAGDVQHGAGWGVCGGAGAGRSYGWRGPGFL